MSSSPRPSGPRLDHPGGGQVVADVHDDLEQRVTRQRAHRADAVDHPVERQILVGVGGQRRLPGPDATASRSVGLPVRSLRSTRMLTKKPISWSNSASVRPATGVPSGMSTPPPALCSTTATAVCSSMNSVMPNSRHSSVSLARVAASMREVDGFTLAAGHRLPREVGPQPGVLRHPGQLPVPVLPLLDGDRGLLTTRSPAQERALPRRVVGVLHAKRRPGRRLPGPPGPVRGQHVGEQHARRPVVGGDVVDHQRQHVLARVLAGVQHRDPDRPARGPARSSAGARRPVARSARLRSGPVGAAHGRPRRPARPPGRARRRFRRRTGAQDLVAGNDVADRGDQCLDVPRPGQLRGERNVVDPAGPVDTVGEPAAQLRRRQRQRLVVGGRDQLGPRPRELAGLQLVDPLRQQAHRPAARRRRGCQAPPRNPNESR